MTTYGDITPRTAAFVVKDMLERGQPLNIIEKFGKSKPLPKNNTQSMTFRRYFLTHTLENSQFQSGVYYGTSLFDPTTLELTEGSTPSATKLESKDITVQLKQYGARTEITDVVQDTHEDPVLQEAVDVLGEQATVVMEKMRFNKLVAGTNVSYANGSSRSDVNEPISLSLQRRATRQLKRNLGKPITKVISSTPSYNTHSVAPSYVALCHPDLEADIRGLDGFTPVEQYGSYQPFDGEIGKIEDVRYVSTTIFEAWEDAGGVYDGGSITAVSTSGSNADVYPVLFLARDAYALTPLKGKTSLTPMVVNPKPSDSDPLAQRGHVGWKAFSSCVILNDQWMVRGEVAATDL